MTTLTTERRVRRETKACDRSRPIMVELFPGYVSVRVKGTREVHNVPWDAVLDLGRKLDFMAAERKRLSA